jgi:hypothetical protein
LSVAENSAVSIASRAVQQGASIFIYVRDCQTEALHVGAASVIN